MDRNKKHTLPLAVIPAVFFLLLAGGCDNRVYDGMDTDTPAREVSLDFNASIENTESVQTKSFDPIEGLQGGDNNFGMSITKVENGSEAFMGSSDMRANLSTIKSEWSFYENTIPAPSGTLIPVGPVNKELKVIAYYPFNKFLNNVYTKGIPFDFSVKKQVDFEQSDLLYNTETRCTPVSDPTAVNLNFRHAYTWIVLNITKYVNKQTEKDKPVKLSAVSLDNLKGEWIKNKGFIDPETGLVMKNAAAGPIGVTIDSPVELSTGEGKAQTFNFLVPSFMDPQLSDGEIVIVLKVNEIDELFTLDKSYLNQSDDKKSFGFRQGYKNTYNLVYNNSALSLNVQSWSSVVLDGDFGGDIVPPSTSDAYMVDIKYVVDNPTNNWPIKNNILTEFYPALPTVSMDTLLYRDYLTTVAYGGNGEYLDVSSPTEEPPVQGVRITDDLNVQKEPVFGQIDMTKNDLSVSPVPWEDANGKLVAKEICRNYKGGGHTDWRLPRASELRAVFAMMTVPTGGLEGKLQFNLNDNRNKLYWTGTEVDESQAWSIYYDNKDTGYSNKYIVLSPLDKKMTASVRCVRNVVPSK